MTKKKKSEGKNQQNEQQKLKSSVENNIPNQYQRNVDIFREKLENSSILATIECIGVIVEFMVIMIFFSSAFNPLIQNLNLSSIIPNSSNQTFNIFVISLVQILEWSFTSISVIIYFIFRYHNRISNPPLNISSFFGLKLKFAFPSRILLIILLLIVIEFIFSIIFELYKSPEQLNYLRILNFDLYINDIQTRLNFLNEMSVTHSLYTTNTLNFIEYVQSLLNIVQKYFLSSQADIQWKTIFQLVFITPFLEEFIFRGLLINTFVRRTNKINWKTYAIPSILFGLFHLINIPSSRYSTPYILLQVLAGCLVGSFYSIHFVQQGRLWECVSMHMINNFLCSLLPRYSSASELFNFNVLFQILGTILSCYYLLVIGGKKSCKVDSKKNK